MNLKFLMLKVKLHSNNKKKKNNFFNDRHFSQAIIKNKKKKYCSFFKINNKTIALFYDFSILPFYSLELSKCQSIIFQDNLILLEFWTWIIPTNVTTEVIGTPTFATTRNQEPIVIKSNL